MELINGVPLPVVIPASALSHRDRPDRSVGENGTPPPLVVNTRFLCKPKPIDRLGI
jgi:hypothetical protein